MMEDGWAEVNWYKVIVLGKFYLIITESQHSDGMKQPPAVLLTVQLDYHWTDGNQGLECDIWAEGTGKRHTLLRGGAHHIWHSFKLLSFIDS